MHVEITTRHGTLGPEQHAHVLEKAQKLRKYFSRLMAVEVDVEQRKNDWLVAILVSAEHKHDFVARESESSVLSAMDLCVHKIEEQLRRYKERIQSHKGDTVPGRDSTGPEAASTTHGPGES